MSLDLVIIGGGIKGAATAAIASLSADFNVTLLERDRIGSGATSTNHGRLHLGTAGWEHEAPELIQRRRLASHLVRQLPDVLVANTEGLYCFEDIHDAERFQSVAERDGIPYRIAKRTEIGDDWLNASRYPRLLHIPEYAFNPARLAGRFAQTCLDHGGTVLTQHDVQRIDRESSKLHVHLANGEILHADIVINMLARWGSTISLPASAPRLDIRWFQWQLLCLHTAALPTFPDLERVIMIIDNARQMPSAIPHHDWITLDYKATHVQEVISPDGEDIKNWRQFDMNQAIDADNFSSVADVFKPLSSYPSYELTPHLFSLTGIHGRRLNVPPGSQNTVEMSPLCPGYVVAFGGQASTGLLDAIETIEQIRTWYNCGPEPRDQVISNLQQQLASQPIDHWMPMRWEQHIFSEAV